MVFYKIDWLLNNDTEIKSASTLCNIYNVNIIHLKRVYRNGESVNYFWNNKRKEIIKGCGTIRKLDNILSLSLDYSSCDGSVNKEVQVGDSVMVYKRLTHNEESFIFGYVTGIMVRGSRNSYEITRISLDRKIDGTTIRVLRDESVPIFFLSDGVKDRYEKSAATNNLLRVKYKYQIDAAEFILGNANAFAIIWNKYSKRKLPIGEAAFKDVHHAMFGLIYPWGGVYREHEVVVGDRNRSTISSKDIKSSMRACFRRVSKNRLEKIVTKNDLALTLTDLHKELAWIHPFEDGNGRSIRMYLLILSLSMGFIMDLSMLNGDKKRKSYYHFAVRKSIYDSNNRYLFELLCGSLRAVHEKIEVK